MEVQEVFCRLQLQGNKQSVENTVLFKWLLSSFVLLQKLILIGNISSGWET